MKITKRQRQIRRIVKEEKRRVLKRRLAKSLYEEQGYDAREDEHLGAEHGAAAEHDQDYKDRRDDAGFETHHESTARGGRKLRISKRQLMRIIREERAKIKK